MPASIFAWPGAVAIGVSLGLLGSGGSILTVPVLVYLIGQDEKVAIAGSLFVVGTIALVGSLQFLRAKLVDWHNVLVFGLPGMAGTYLQIHRCSRSAESGARLEHAADCHRPWYRR